MVMENTMPNSSTAGTPTLMCTKASVLPTIAFAPSVQMSMQEIWKYLPNNHYKKRFDLTDPQ